jgi:hypothetical protein
VFVQCGNPPWTRRTVHESEWGIDHLDITVLSVDRMEMISRT